MAKGKAAVAEIVKALARAYPDSTCALTHKSAFELLAATILSAQCTDVRVNLVTPALFQRFPTAEALAGADPGELEAIVRSTGFFRNKAKSLRGAARVIHEKHGGRVPDTMEELLELPGVARKTANVVLGTWFGRATGVVVDTHVSRIAGRLGLTKQKDPTKIEQDLMKLLPEKAWIDFSHRLIWHGRKVCSARKPLCDQCPLERQCSRIGVIQAPVSSKS